MSRYREILQKYWGYSSFRGIQEEIINSIGSGRDTLGLMPTGGGKSITFQVPALAQEGLCLVVTPLIALMKDQVANLRARGIKATAIYAGLTRQEIITALENCIFGDYKFLYVSPERLASELFQAKLSRIPVSFITVDESHCISQWGYDFRPSYLQIAQIRKQIPHAPILALTATATPEVVEDIQEKLEFREKNVFRMSFERKNLAYVVRRTENKPQELLHILTHTQGTAIVYTRSRNRTKEVADLLRENDITAEFYHAGLPHAEKDARQERWQKDQSRVMVATNAFGMGIDKPDVRTVIHIDLPDSPEAYFQEAGRAGRDGKPAYAVLLVSPGDPTILRQRLPNTFPDKEFIRQIYEHLSYFYQIAMGSGCDTTHEFDINKFCHNFKHYPVQTDSALRILTQAGYIEYTDEQENDSRLMFTVKRDELYSMREDDRNDEIIRAVLRLYSGVFADYVYIDESLIARHMGLTQHEVYERLKSLNYHHIIHYIPRKRIPLITYTRRREEADRIVITPEVYEKRKATFNRRIEAMLEYATSDNTCRSRLLLNYFGEQNGHNCRCCDVCLHAHDSGMRQGAYEEVARLIEELLHDSDHISLTDFCQRAETICPPDKALQALHFLEKVGTIHIEGENILPSHWE